MTKRRGNKTSEVARLERQQDIVQLRAEGLTLDQIVTRTGRSRATVWRDLKRIGQELRLNNDQQISQLREQQHTELTELKRILFDLKMSDAQKIRAFLQVSVRISKLLGLDAPQKSIEYRVDIPVRLMTPIELDHNIGLARAAELIGDLTEEEWRLTRDFILELRNHPPVDADAVNRTEAKELSAFFTDEAAAEKFLIGDVEDKEGESEEDKS